MVDWYVHAVTRDISVISVYRLLDNSIKHKQEIPGLNFYNATIGLNEQGVPCTAVLCEEAGDLSIPCSKPEVPRQEIGDQIGDEIDDAQVRPGVHTVQDASPRNRETSSAPLTDLVASSNDDTNDESSSTSSAESNYGSENQETHVTMATPHAEHLHLSIHPPVGPSKNQTFGPISDINWPNYEAIIILGNLPEHSSVEWLYECLRAVGFSFQL